MPTFRIWLDKSAASHSQNLIETAWPKMQAAAVELFAVPPAVCKLSLIAVENAPGNYPINVEISFLIKPERSREKTEALCAAVFDAVQSATQISPFVGASMREPEHFVFRK